MKRHKFNDNSKIRIKISNLPNDVTVKELNELISDWGRIGRINIKFYRDCSIAYVDFYDNQEAEYFVRAINKTSFDHMILDVEILK
tara:strand:- start:124 stop:381 length:258 start_codon:yes stop_codon:yes gene_type:complete